MYDFILNIYNRATRQVYRDGKYTSPKCVIVNGRREREKEITPGPSDYAPSRSDIMSRHRRQPVYVMARADSAKRRQAQMTVTPGYISLPNRNATLLGYSLFYCTLLLLLNLWLV